MRGKEIEIALIVLIEIGVSWILFRLCEIRSLKMTSSVLDCATLPAGIFELYLYIAILSKNM
ncbi:MAG: hypothetical protein VX831_05400, partial [Candidatus Thermoplasmatota archaeon]|nr:hypothetical protein [Candidatus Thermoplasmatota archaeon]